MDAKTPAAATTRHELFITDGNATFRWAITDSGVTLSADGLSWSIGGVEIERSYSDISSIRLHRASAGTSAGVGVCQIRFRDGTTLVVYGGSAQGLADDTQAARFAAFVRDLHKRLAAREESKAHLFPRRLERRPLHGSHRRDRGISYPVRLVAARPPDHDARPAHAHSLWDRQRPALVVLQACGTRTGPALTRPTSVPEELLS